MADNVDKFGISLDLDISGLQAEMVKAENELRKFQAELKRSTDTGEITKLTASISNLDEKIAHLGQRMGSTAKPTADATNALTNLSRVAQDAPYGFMGIANNLNPMLESFQRLQKESGGTGNALKSLASGLMGPAGIGLALGAVSSLLIAFGDDIMEFINKTTEFEKAQKSMRDGFAENTKSIGETIAKDEALISVITNVTQSTEARNEALKKLKSEYKGNIELQKTDIEDGAQLEGILRRISAALLRKAEIEAISKVIGEEYAKQVRLQISTTKEQVQNLSFVTKAFDALKATMMPGNLTKNYNNLVNTDALAKNKKDIKEFGDAIGRLQTLLEGKTGEAFKAGDYSVIGGGSKPDKKAAESADKDKISEVQKIIQKLREEQKTLDYELSKGMINELPEGKNKKSYYTEKIDAISDAIKKLAGLTSTEAKKALGDLEKELSGTKVEELGKILDRRGREVEGAMAERKADPEQLKRGLKVAEGAGAKNAYEQEQRRIKALDKELKEAQMTAENFANFLASGVTNGLMGMWDAMEQGEDVMESFGNFLKDMVKQLIAMAIQAALVKSIMAAFGGGADGAGGGGLLAGIGKIFGFAEGAVVTQPTLAMIGEGGQGEAVMPLNKLGNMMNSTFNAGAMSGQGSGGTGQFILRGQDLLLSVNRAQKAGNIKGQSISLA
jgi:hypothetical protein